MAFKKALVAAAALSLFQFTAAWNIELPPCVDEFKPFIYSGCYQDASPNALEYRSGADRSTMTVEKCIAECKGNGFRYAGLKYYGECYCGATVKSPVPRLEESVCSFKCNGNKTETCGGQSSLSIWQDPTFEIEPSQVPVGAYVPLGCYTDDGSTPGRTLSWPQKIDEATFTPDKCLSACRDKGYPFAGTEYGKECWCGNVLANDTISAPMSECSSKCKGDTTLTCGGPGRLSLYVAKELQSLQPCGYKPPVSSSSSTVIISTTTSSIASSSSSTTSESTTSESTSSESTSSTTSSESTSSTTTSSTTTSAGSTTSSDEVISTTSSKTTSSSAPITTTTSTTTTSSKVTTTSSAPQCTKTVTIPSECEYKCGNWCAPSIPDWGDKDNCLAAYKSCATQVTSCLKKAGWPGVLNCFDFGKWCSGVESFCKSDSCKSGSKWCNKKSCFDKNQPVAPQPPKVTTTVYPCPVTTTTTTTSTVPTSCAPEPTNICKQPTNNKYDYSPDKPVGGIELPLVGCNDFYDDWKSNPFKLYNDENTRRCKSYTRPQCGNACTEACKEQYDDCLDVYAESCKKFGWRSYFHKREADAETSEVEKRFLNLFGAGLLFGGDKDNYSQANTKCKAQYNDCLALNKNINPGDRCKTWGKGY